MLDSDWHGWYKQCLQCGHLRDLQTIIEPREPNGSMKRRTHKTNPDLREAPRVATG